MPADLVMSHLRDRRSRMLDEMERQRFRGLNGEMLVAALVPVVGTEVSLADFRIDVKPPFPVDWPRRLEDAKGFVAAYVPRAQAQAMAKSMEARMPDMGGLVGIHDKDYLGLCAVSRASVAGMVDAASAANDAITFYPASLGGVILLDCYAGNPLEPFSIIVQGTRLMDRLAGCFGRHGDRA